MGREEARYLFPQLRFPWQPVSGARIQVDSGCLPLYGATTAIATGFTTLH